MISGGLYHLAVTWLDKSLIFWSLSGLYLSKVFAICSFLLSSFFCFKGYIYMDPLNLSWLIPTFVLSFFLLLSDSKLLPLVLKKFLLALCCLNGYLGYFSFGEVGEATLILFLTAYGLYISNFFNFVAGLDLLVI